MNALSTTKRQSEGCRKNFWLFRLLLAAQYGNPGNTPGFVKVVHELLGIAKGTCHFQIEPAGMNAQPGGGLLVLFAERSSSVSYTHLTLPTNSRV